MNYEFKREEKKKINKKKITKIVSVIAILCMIIGTIIAYIYNHDVREYIDYRILQKEIMEENTKTIKLEDEKNSYVSAYSKYIAVLNSNIMHVYNSSAKEQFQLDIPISDPLFQTKNNFLLIAEKNGQKVYLVSDKNIVWRNEVDGQIIGININRNGYVSVIVSQNTYKTIVITYNPEGQELFKYFLSNSYAIDTDISNDNKYLAIAEVNTDGTQIKSGIRILSLEKLETDIDNSIVYQKTTDSNQMITAIQYNVANNLIAMFDNKVDLIKDNQESTLLEFDVDTLFANINAGKEIISTKQIHNAELSVQTETTIINTVNNRQSQYIIEDIPKEILTNTNTIAINTGMEAYFVSNNGWLKNKYVAKQEIKEIILGSDIAGIVYNNKINIIKI